MAETNAELYDTGLRQIAAGFKTLADVPDAEEIDGENVRFPLPQRRDGDGDTTCSRRYP